MHAQVGKALVMVVVEFITIHRTSSFIFTHHRSIARKGIPSAQRTLHCNTGIDMASRYQIAAYSGDGKRIRVSFSDTNNTTIAFNRGPQETSKEDLREQQNVAISNAIPESVLQYERQLKKIQALDRASKTNVTVEDHLDVLHVDEHFVVTNKPSGILCVPGVNKYRSLLDLVYETYGNGNTNGTDDNGNSSQLHKDSMIVHRLDMDTSGLVVFARSRLGMSKLHEAFREKTGTEKIYEALLVGWLDINRWVEAADTVISDIKSSNKSIVSKSHLGEGEIDLPLQRDHKHPPFMRVSTLESETEAQQAVKDLNHAGWKKLVAKRPKPSVTHFSILSFETWNDHPVTRVALTPVTGRTHQLRVHCAALGHPILGDPVYGYCGEANPNGGFSDDTIIQMSPTFAGMELRRDVDKFVKDSGRTMCLHAKKLGFIHPTSGKFVCFEASPLF